MTDEKTGDASKSRPEWVDDTENTLNRAAESFRAAWSATREPRMSALESAKQAARQLGEALEKGSEAARQKWQDSSPEEE